MLTERKVATVDLAGLDRGTAGRPVLPPFDVLRLAEGPLALSLTKASCSSALSFTMAAFFLIRYAISSGSSME